MNLQDIRNLIGHDDIPGAIRALISLVDEGAVRSKRLRDDLFILSNRFEALHRRELIGEIEPAEAVRERTQVNRALMNLIGEIETGRTDQEPPEEKMTAAEKKAPRLNRRLVYGIAAVLAVIAIFFILNRPQPSPYVPGPTPPEPQPEPEFVIDINGYWLTNVPNLVYLFRQSGTSFTWSVVGAPQSAGTGRIEGENIIAEVDGRSVVLFVTQRFPDRQPSEIRTHDPQFQHLIFSRERQDR
jgi:hypothetical protein